MGLLDFFYPTDPDQQQMQLAIGLGLMDRGLLGGAKAFQEQQRYLQAAKRQGLLDQREGLLADAKLDNYKSEAESRRAKMAREQAELDTMRKKRDALPTLWDGTPQLGQLGSGTLGALPAPGGNIMPQRGQLNWRRALAEGYTADEIGKLAGLENLGRPKATRQIEVDDGRGGKRLALVDDYGQEVAGFAGYTAPVQVNRGDRVDFVKPAPGVSLGVNMSPSEQNSAALGWANNALTRRGQDLTDARAREANGVVKPQFHDGQWVTPPTPQNPQGVTVPAAGFTKSLGEGAKKQVSGIDALGGAVDEYVKKLNDFGISGLARPDKRAEMGTVYNNMMLQAKEAYNLGVLNGPDYKILTDVVTNPVSFKGAITSNEAMEKQATELKRIMGDVRKGLTGQGNHSAPPVGTVQGGYRFKGGNPADPNSWEKQ